jgi:hypothetical protein
MSERAEENFSISYNYLQEYQLLSIVHQLFSSLEDVAGDLDEFNFELAALEAGISAIIEESSTEREMEISARLTLWRQVLEKFDAQFTVANLRHQFEEVGLPDPRALELLLAFYLTKVDRMSEDRDKIDLIVTRWGRLAFQTRENETMLLPAPALRERVEELYQRYRLELVVSEQLNQRKQLLIVRSLRELVEKQILLRLRKVKNELGDLFFQPAVLAEIVALNLSLHNVFQDLFLAEQSRLTSFLQQQGEELQVTGADQVLASMIERPTNRTDNSDNLPPIVPTEENLPATVTLNRSDLKDFIVNMRSMLSLLDQQLHSLAEKLES